MTAIVGEGADSPLEHLAAALRAPEGAVVVGLMSGTSADGVDAACCRLAGRGRALRCEVLGTAATPYPDSLAEELRRPEAIGAPGVGRLSVLVGSIFADAALAAVAAAGLDRRAVALVGSHGQTIWHDPRGTRGGVACTLQIGEASIIAERTGLPVWHDFRPADVAAGGEGAPLVPYVDWVLFTLPDRWTVCLNLGGIANVTILPPGAGPADVVAFDTGPGNMVLDHLAVALLGRPHDEGGEAAAAGAVDLARLAAALEDPYFALPAPKSTGREYFGRAWTEAWLDPIDEPGEGAARDRLATAAAVTVESVARALEGRAGTTPVPKEARVLVSGGGRRNRALMEGLARRLAPREVLTVDEAGLDGDHKEAIAFAILAYESALGSAVAMPRATGARHPARLGKLALPPPEERA